MIPTTEYVPYFSSFIESLDSGVSIVSNLETVQNDFENVLRNISSKKENYAYAEGKWTIKELIQHLIDSERVFMHRCFRIARRDPTPLAGFDQNIYISPSNASNKSIGDLLEEFKISFEP